jgi:ABC-type multidrug transport system ATPase subunit
VSVPVDGPEIRFDKIDKRYGGLYALRRVSLDIAKGDCVVLAGRNGSGKTTLLRVAARLARPTAGTVTFAGDHAGAASRPATPGFVAHATLVYDELTAEENLLLFGRLLGVPDNAARVAGLLEEIALTERRTSLVRTFSRGMRQRVAVARALLHRPSMLLLDEPATGLDSVSVAWLANTLKQLRDSGCTILMSLHGESEISALATRAIRLEAGTVAADSASGASLKSILSFSAAS